MKKTCTICKKLKLLEEFYKNPTTKDKRGSQCKKCDTKERKRMYQERKIRLLNLNISDDDKESILISFKYMFNRCRKSTITRNKKGKNFEFNISLEYIKRLWEEQKGICPYTGIKMKLPLFNSYCPESASIDRMDSSKGYIEGNVEIVCLSVNYAKSRFSKDVLKNFFNQIKNNNPL